MAYRLRYALVKQQRQEKAMLTLKQIINYLEVFCTFDTLSKEEKDYYTQKLAQAKQLKKRKKHFKNIGEFWQTVGY